MCEFTNIIIIHALNDVTEVSRGKIIIDSILCGEHTYVMYVYICKCIGILCIGICMFKDMMMEYMNLL